MNWYEFQSSFLGNYFWVFVLFCFVYCRYKSFSRYLICSIFSQAIVYIYIYIFFFFLHFLGLHLWHMEVSRLGNESELQLLAYTTATASQI